MGYLVWIRLTSTILIGVSCYFWMRLALWRSPKTMSDLSSTTYGLNKDALKNLVSEKSDIIVAFFLLAVGMALDVIATMIELGFGKTLIFTIPVMYLVYRVGNYYARSKEKEILGRLGGK